MSSFFGMSSTKRFFYLEKTCVKIANPILALHGSQVRVKNARKK